MTDAVCANCGTDTIAIADLLEAMVHEVVAAGGLVEHVGAHTGLASDMVAAKLRVPLW